MKKLLIGNHLFNYYLDLDDRYGDANSDGDGYGNGEGFGYGEAEGDVMEGGAEKVLEMVKVSEMEMEMDNYENFK